MSRLFPERLVLTLSPAPGSAADRDPWHGAIRALQPAKLPKAKVTVVLSNHFVRYALVPWSDALAGAAEETTYVRHHFVRIHGERAKAWSFRASPAPAGAPRLCSAIDANLLSALKESFKNAKAKLASVQPQLMAAFNRWRGAVPAAGAWLVLVEPERACIALHSRGSWQAVHNGRMSARGEWLALLERERHRIGGEVPDMVLLHSSQPVAAEAPGWKLQRLAP